MGGSSLFSLWNQGGGSLDKQGHSTASMCCHLCLVQYLLWCTLFRQSCNSEFVQKHICPMCKKLAFVDHFCQYYSACPGARAAELLINTDQNPQCGGNRPQTINCLRLSCARSHDNWLHSLQFQVWVRNCSWRYECIDGCLYFCWLRFREAGTSVQSVVIKSLYVVCICMQ